MKRKCLVVGMILLFVGTCIIPAIAQNNEKQAFPSSRGNWLYVGGSGPGNYTKIQDAIDNASDGDTVFVFAGRYYERVRVDKTIHLLGENKTRTILCFQGEGWSKPVLSLCMNGIVISDLTVNITTGTGSCINFSKDYCQISNTIIQGAYSILVLKSCNNNEIFNNLLQSKYGFGFNGSGNYIHHNHFCSSGVDLVGKETRNNIISDNFFDKCYSSAIETDDASDNSIERNVIIGDPAKDEYGIHLKYSNALCGGNIIRDNIIKNCSGCGIAAETNGDTITGNFIEKCGYGLSIEEYIIFIKNNTIRDCQVGQDLWYSDHPTILEGNLYEHCIEGIEVWYCQNVTFTKNTFRNNTYGVSCHVDHRNTFYRNNFEGNNLDVFSQISHDWWLLNYWNRPRLLPKPLFGYLPIIQFDWRPALQPN